MSQAQIIVKYDGPLLAGHRMDVEQVAPAMLALSELVKRANKIANGNRASVKVLVNADIDEHCFSFGIEIVQTFLEHARDLLADDDVATALEIAEIVGLVEGGIGGLFGLLKFLAGRTPDSTSMVFRDGRDIVQINAGRDVYYVSSEAKKLYDDAEAIREAKTVTKPVTEEGYISVEFKSNEKIERFTQDDAKAIQDTPPPLAEVESAIPPSKIRAWVKIRRAVYEGGARWNIQYDKARDVTMGDDEWLRGFQNNQVTAPPGSLLDVEMTVSGFEFDNRGRLLREPEYTITKVHDVRRPERNVDLFDAQEEDHPQISDQTEKD